jgi:hypothetical protein
VSVKFLAGPKVKLSYSADAWQIYSERDSEEPLYVKGVSRDEVAAALNAGLEELIAAAASRGEFNWRAAEKLLGKYSEYGAADSEGYHMVENVLDRVYGERVA